MPIKSLAARKRVSSAAWGSGFEALLVSLVSWSVDSGVAEMEKSLLRSPTREERVMPESLKRLLRFAVSEEG